MFVWIGTVSRHQTVICLFNVDTSASKLSAALISGLSGGRSRLTVLGSRQHPRPSRRLTQQSPQLWFISEADLADAKCPASQRDTDSSMPHGPFPAQDHATFSQEVFNVCCAQSKTMIRPDRISDDLTRKTKALKERHIRQNFHESHLRQPERLNNLAMLAPDIVLYSSDPTGSSTYWNAPSGGSG